MDSSFNQQPPVFVRPQLTSPVPPQTRMSILAIVSLIAGLLSPLFIVACFLSLITSAVAIVTGHIALAKISQPANRLDGRPVALVGLVFGYMSMGLTIALLTFIFTRPPSNLSNSASSIAKNTAQSRLNEAELSIISGSKSNVARGNSELAQEVAENFARSMKRAADVIFTSNRKPGIQLSGGEYVTHCELHEDSCAFIVHVPSYRHFTKDAEKALNTVVWIAATEAVKDHLKQGDAIAVGLRGTMTYGDILIGTFTDDDGKMDFTVGAARDLVPFFGEEGKRRLDLRGGPADLLKEPSAEVSDASPFTPSEPSEVVKPVPAQPIERPTEPMTSEASSDTPSVLLPAEPLAANLPAVEPLSPEPLAPPAETPKINSSQKRKREVPAFENKIPVSLEKSIDAQGWNIESMIFIRDGAQLVTGGLDETISVFDTRTGRMLFRSERQGELGQIVSLALSKDGRTLFAGGSTGRVASYEIKDDGKVESVRSLYKHNRNVGCLVVSPTFPFVLSGGEDGTVAWQPYDDRSSSLRIVQELKRKVLAAHLFVDRNEGIATDGQSLIQFSVKDSKVLAQRKLSKSYPHAAAISPDGSRCAVSYGSDVTLFETASGKQKGKPFASSEMIWSLMFHPTQPWLIMGGRGNATIWDVNSAERLAVLDAGSIQYVSNLAITADGNTFALIPTSAGQSIHVFDLTPDGERSVR